MLTFVNTSCRYMWLIHDSLYPFRIFIKSFKTLPPRRKTCFNSLLMVTSSANVPSVPRFQIRSLGTKINIPINEVDKPKIVKHSSMGDSVPINQSVEGGIQFNAEGGSSHQRQKSGLNGHSASMGLGRHWEITGNNTSNNTSNSLRFKVVSYNVLAQCLLETHQYLYDDCPSQTLQWPCRSSRLYHEIIKLNPDILCLQEVEQNHLDSFYYEIEKLGYHGIYKQKTGNRDDGCAIYFRKSVFKLIDHISVEFYQPDLPLLNRDNIGIVVKLMPLCSSKSQLVIATTHLLYNPKRTDVRLAQMQILLAEIDRFSYINNGSTESGHLPVILTGDFNSTPDSPVVELLDSGHVSAFALRDCSDWRKIGVTDNCQHLSVYLNRQKGDSAIYKTQIYNSENSSNDTGKDVVLSSEYNGLFNSNDIGHTLKLKSVYNRVKKNGDFEATTFQNDWVTVDYIYFSCHSSLNLLKRLRLPTVTECEEQLFRLPNGTYGSDHLSLGAIFDIKLM